MENDLHFMEHTEKLVAEMLKSVLGTNDLHRFGERNGLKIDESVEYVIIDETEKFKSTCSNEMNLEPTNRNEFDKFAMRMDHEFENQNMDYSRMSDLEALISEGLNKIRLEYPMYAAAADTNAYGNCPNSSIPVFGVTPLTENAFGSIEYNTWSSDLMNTRTDGACSPIYHNDMNRFYGEEYWNDTQYDSNGASVVWSQSNIPLLNVTNNRTGSSNDTTEDIETETISDEETNVEEDHNKGGETKASNSLPSEPGIHCIMTQQDGRQLLCNKAMPESLMQAELSHLNVNNNINGISTATGGAATTHVQICAGSTNAIHAAQSTTTTTTTAAGFGVLHQQTSCTTTNFVPNTLANAVLATSPAALYAQSILTSTANQYLNVFRKEIQQYFINNSNNNYCNATASSNWNYKIYERLLYAQLLQQQILQQQQQQAAIANLLQQQKLALQNNAANIAVATAATYSNANVVASSSNTTGNAAINNVGNDGGYQFATSIKNVCNSSSKYADRGKNNSIVDLTEKNFNSLMPAVTEDCMGECLEKAILE